MSDWLVALLMAVLVFIVGNVMLYFVSATVPSEWRTAFAVIGGIVIGVVTGRFLFYAWALRR